MSPADFVLQRSSNVTSTSTEIQRTRACYIWNWFRHSPALVVWWWCDQMSSPRVIYILLFSQQRIFDANKCSIRGGKNFYCILTLIPTILGRRCMSTGDFRGSSHPQLVVCFPDVNRINPSQMGGQQIKLIQAISLNWLNETSEKWSQLIATHRASTVFSVDRPPQRIREKRRNLWRFQRSSIGSVNNFHLIRQNI